MPRNCLAALLLTALAAVGVFPVHAWGAPPIKVNASFNFKFNVKVGPTNQNKAPWYSYFPYDPNLQAPSTGNPYPNWPSSLPPGEKSSNDKSAQASRFPNWPGHPDPNPVNPSEPAIQARALGQSTGLFATTSFHQVARPSWQTSNNCSVPTSSQVWAPMAPVAQVPAYWYGR